MKKKNQELSPMMTLPPELLQKIFLRLPVRSLIQLKCVSKQWLSLISDHHFAKLHYDVTIAPTNNNNDKFLYLSRDCFMACCVKMRPEIHHDYPFKLQETYKNGRIRIMGSCRGFVLLRNNKPEPVLILWNPATSSRVQVPYPNNFWNSEFHRSDFFCGGVVYEKFNDDYLVIIGARGTQKGKPQWKFFSIRTNSWKEIEGGDCFIPIIDMHNQLGMLYNEAIHWLVVYNGSDKPQDFVIVAFDIATKTLSMIPLPCSQDSKWWIKSLLRGGGGCFGICMMNDMLMMEIWVMKEYKVESSWTKLGSVYPSSGIMIPLCFTQSGDEVVCKNIKDPLKYKDLLKYRNKRVVEKFSLDFCDKVPVLVMFNESLFSLPRSNKQGE